MILKRFLDIIASFFGLIFISPLLIFLAIIIKLTSSGPVFYRGARVGKDGKEFLMFKFRSMVPGADKLGGPSTAVDDPRLTKIGKFMKKYQLDELPQLINVFKGEMSLVGPRPEVKMYVDMMTDEERNVILSVLPGITDLASLWNFHEGEILKGSPDPEKTYQEKIWPEKKRLQMKYVKDRSFWLDLKIILQTILKVFQ
ncbi:MAG: sugar transferase [Candidatus Staskawiczbacteria bacterium]|nr:sugar transferase [Candidatus Staskawiczbacteria bacterium]